VKPACAITGANGYVGSVLARALATEFDVVPLSRRNEPGSIAWSLDSERDIAPELRQRGVKVLVHAAWDFTHPEAAENERVNVGGARHLLECATRAGVERIVFISSISAFVGARSNYGRAKLQVEELVLARWGTVIRPGLVWGATPGGMFGSLRKQVATAKFIPLIGDGRAPQYLVHEEDLGAAVLRAAQGDRALQPRITLAAPQPWPFRDLLLAIARSEGRQPTLVPVPWRLIYLGLRAAEKLGMKLGFRSDSVISFIYQDPAPDFASAERSGLPTRAFSITH